MRMEAIAKPGDHAEISATPSQSPEQVSILVRRGSHHPPVHADDPRLEKIVATETMLARQPAEAAAQGQAGDARGRDQPSGRREAMVLRCGVECAPEHAAAGLREAAAGRP